MSNNIFDGFEQESPEEVAKKLNIKKTSTAEDILDNMEDMIQQVTEDIPLNFEIGAYNAVNNIDSSRVEKGMYCKEARNAHQFQVTEIKGNGIIKVKNINTGSSFVATSSGEKNYFIEEQLDYDNPTKWSPISEVIKEPQKTSQLLPLGTQVWYKKGNNFLNTIQTIVAKEGNSFVLKSPTGTQYKWPLKQFLEYFSIHENLVQKIKPETKENTDEEKMKFIELSQNQLEDNNLWWNDDEIDLDELKPGMRIRKKDGKLGIIGGRITKIGNFLVTAHYFNPENEDIFSFNVKDGYSIYKKDYKKLITSPLEVEDNGKWERIDDMVQVDKGFRVRYQNPITKEWAGAKIHSMEPNKITIQYENEMTESFSFLNFLEKCQVYIEDITSD